MVLKHTVATFCITFQWQNRQGTKMQFQNVGGHVTLSPVKVAPLLLFQIVHIKNAHSITTCLAIVSVQTHTFDCKKCRPTWCFCLWICTAHWCIAIGLYPKSSWYGFYNSSATLQYFLFRRAQILSRVQELKRSGNVAERNASYRADMISNSIRQKIVYVIPNIYVSEHSVTLHPTKYDPG